MSSFYFHLYFFTKKYCSVCFSSTKYKWALNEFFFLILQRSEILTGIYINPQPVTLSDWYTAHISIVWNTNTAWKASKYGVFSGTYFPAFWLNTERYFVSLRIQSKCGKIRTRKNSIFGHFSSSQSIWFNISKNRWFTFLK